MFRSNGVLDCLITKVVPDQFSRDSERNQTRADMAMKLIVVLFQCASLEQKGSMIKYLPYFQALLYKYDQQCRFLVDSIEECASASAQRTPKQFRIYRDLFSSDVGR